MTKRSVRRTRRAFVLAAALVCLFIATLGVGTLLHSILLRHAQVRLEQRRVQAVWLAQSGVERATARLRATPDYNGETWLIDAAQFGGVDAGKVIISIVREEGDSPAVRVHVAAEFPSNTKQHVRVRRQATVAAATGDAS